MRIKLTRVLYLVSMVLNIIGVIGIIRYAGLIPKWFIGSESFYVYSAPMVPFVKLIIVGGFMYMITCAFIDED